VSSNPSFNCGVKASGTEDLLAWLEPSLGIKRRFEGKSPVDSIAFTGLFSTG